MCTSTVFIYDSSCASVILCFTQVAESNNTNPSFTHFYLLNCVKLLKHNY